MKKLLITLILFLLSACNADKIQSQPIENFDINKYLGKWYEIARTDNRFEKNCTHVTANYSLRKDGGVNVTNKCLRNGKEKTAKGIAYFKNEKNVGALKVTFFWPFFGNYNVSYIDNNYQYAIVDGGSKQYLWILSRTESLDDAKLKMLLEKIKHNGFDTESLIYTVHHE
jgi:apolipoprotein D and lipocalin family protein